jgi:hypothetical protein
LHLSSHLNPDESMDGWEFTPHHPLQYHVVFHPEVEANIIILGASSAMHAINSRYLKADRLKFGIYYEMKRVPHSSGVRSGWG